MSRALTLCEQPIAESIIGDNSRLTLFRNGHRKTQTEVWVLSVTVRLRRYKGCRIFKGNMLFNCNRVLHAEFVVSIFN